LPDEYGYVASEWSGRNEVPIVLLEKNTLKSTLATKRHKEHKEKSKIQFVPFVAKEIV
jgi:hypothetical protein